MLAAVLAVELTVGCASGSEQTGPDWVLAVGRPTAGFEGGTIRGQMAIENGCLVLESDGLVVPILWPAGSSRDREPVRSPSGRTAEVGDEVALGGGEHRADSEEVRSHVALRSCVEKTDAQTVWIASDFVD